MDIKEKIQQFLKKHRKSPKPLLVGFSGGEDSLTLVHCLHTLGEKIHLAHFDHSWRPTSQEEASHLAQWASERGLPFFSGKGRGEDKTELAARDERYAFFASLLENSDYEALVLAHHRDDQVETVLKRVLEGAQLTSLKGMQPSVQWHNTSLFRPLLGVSKEEVRAYIQKHQLQPIIDATNSDPRYLRARLRHTLIPQLQQGFGKEIAPSFLRMAHYSAELEEYLEEKTKNLQPLSGPFGLMWDFSHAHPVEIRFVLSRWFKKRGITLNQKIFDRIFLALEAKAANHRVSMAGFNLIVDRRSLFFLNVPEGAKTQQSLIVEVVNERSGTGKGTEVEERNLR